MKQINTDMVVYQAKSGAIELKGDVEHETIWATQAQMAQIFGVNPQAITKHIKHIYQEIELLEKSTCSKMEQVQTEGNRTVKRKVTAYNLDVIISVGYRINSVTGTKFRQWATKTLRQHIVKGFTINKSRVKHNYENFLNAVNDVKKLLPATSSESSSIIELIKAFAHTWVSLDAYDKSIFPETGLTKQVIDVNASMIARDIQSLKSQLMEQCQASDLFAMERYSHAVESIFANVFQSFGGSDVYPTIEEKAAHLLYFMVKNHPFIDGNKRSAAFSFVWFMNKANKLNLARISPEALTAITLLVAESNPTSKKKMIGLILMLLNQS